MKRTVRHSCSCLSSCNLHHIHRGHWSQGMCALKDEEICGKRLHKCLMCFLADALGWYTLQRCENICLSVAVIAWREVLFMNSIFPQVLTTGQKKPNQNKTKHCRLALLEAETIMNLPNMPQGVGANFLILRLTQNPIW